ncbi:lipoprotein [Neokomagataea tanensis]|nr:MULTISPECIES: hypothetical protein [Neokomagataea]
MKRFLALVVLSALVVSGLSACGKKGAPHAPGPSQDITYPRMYPPE